MNVLIFISFYQQSLSKFRNGGKCRTIEELAILISLYIYIIVRCQLILKVHYSNTSYGSRSSPRILYQQLDTDSHQLRFFRENFCARREDFNIKFSGKRTYGGANGVASIFANRLLELVQVERYCFLQKFRLFLFLLEKILLRAILGYNWNAYEDDSYIFICPFLPRTKRK